jgi:hypothetical protein
MLPKRPNYIIRFPFELLKKIKVFDIQAARNKGGNLEGE